MTTHRAGSRAGRWQTKCNEDCTRANGGTRPPSSSPAAWRPARYEAPGDEAPPAPIPAATFEGKGGEDGYCVTIHNLSYDTKRYDLKEHVKTLLDGGFGRVDLQTKPDGTSTGRARVGFRFLKDAEAAAKAASGLRHMAGVSEHDARAADLAAILSLPVVLVIDCAKQAQSVAALVRGFRDHRADITIAGLILNRIGSPRHEAMLRTALAPLGIPVLGALPRDGALSLPERHLGLVQAEEHADLGAFLETASAICARHIDLDALRALSTPVAAAPPPSLLPPPGLAPLFPQIRHKLGALLEARERPVGRVALGIVVGGHEVVGANRVVALELESVYQPQEVS